MCGTKTGRRAGTLLQSCKQVRADCRQGADSRRPHKHTTKNGPSRLSRLRSTTHTPCVAAKDCMCGAAWPGCFGALEHKQDDTDTTNTTTRHELYTPQQSTHHNKRQPALSCDPRHHVPDTLGSTVCCGVRTQDDWHGHPSGQLMPTNHIQKTPCPSRKRAGLLPAPGVQQFGNTAIAQTSALLIDGQELGGAVGLHQTIYPNQASVHTSHWMHTNPATCRALPQECGSIIQCARGLHPRPTATSHAKSHPSTQLPR